MRKLNLQKINNRKFWGTLIGSIFFICFILFFTYAYYTWKSDQTDVVLGIQDLSVQCITGDDVNATNIGPVLDYQDGVKAVFSIENGTDESETFSLSLDITSISENLLVDSFKYILVYDTAGGTNYDYDNPVVEGNFVDFKIGSNIITTALTVLGDSTYSYQFIVYIDGSVYNNSNMQENSLVSSLMIGNCGEEEFDPVIATEYIQNLYNDESTISTVNIGGDTVNPTVSLNATQGIMLDNNGEYRYYGANPNNYVSYNGELWRIISVSNVKSSTSDTTGEMRVKLIRDDYIISIFSWDSSDSTINTGYGVNDWTQADLMTELNDLYYNKKSGTCYIEKNNATTACDFTSIGLDDEAKFMADDALWYLGGSYVYESLYANNYYTSERGTTVYDCTDDDGACPRATTWTGKVGLMYASDYAYATDLSSCTKAGYNYSDDSTNCLNTNWLFDSEYGQWTLLPSSRYRNNAFQVSKNGCLAINNAYAPFTIRPTIYLKSDVMLSGGTGTAGNPYQLEIEKTILSDYVQDLYNDGSAINTVNIDGDTANPSVSLNSTQGIMLDNNDEYRYYGADPNNYVNYNGELWRIISVSNVKSSESDTEGEMRAKIIRATSIGQYSWDSSDSSINDGYGVNDWTQADLMTELNDLYYNKKSGTCYTGKSNATTACDFTSIGLNDDAKNLIDDALWYLGGADSGGYGDQVFTYYSYERGSEVYECSTDDGACPRATSWVGKIGLMYPSDYGYATDPTLCPSGVMYSWNATILGDELDDLCAGNDWLYYEEANQMTLTVAFNTPTNYFQIDYSGNLEFDARYVGYSEVVYPTVYLKADVLITGGTGTETDPYTISIG